MEKNLSKLKGVISPIFFVFLVLAISFPLVLRFSTQLYGRPGDPYSVLWGFWWRKNAALLGESPLFSSLIGAPGGFDFSQGYRLIPSEILGDIIARATGEVVAYNLLVLLGLWLAGFGMYRLIWKITKQTLPSLLGGVIFALSPYLLVQSLQHLSLVFIGWLPLLVLGWLNAFQSKALKKTVLWSLVSGLLFTLVATEHFYYGLIAFALGLVYGVAALFWYKKKALVPIFLILVLSVLISLPFLYKPLLPLLVGDPKNLVVATTQRDPAELLTYSANLTNFLLPSPLNPYLGQTFKSFYQARTSSGSNLFELTLFLGWLSLALALVGTLVSLKDKAFRPWTGFLLIIAGVGLFLSSFNFLNLFLFKNLPYFRVVSRFGLLVHFSTAVLAALGIVFLFKIIKTPFLKGVFFLGLISFIFFESFIPGKLIDVSERALPSVYQWLRTQPQGLVAEYPLLPSEEPKGYDYLLWQRFHQKPLVYGAPRGSGGDELRKNLLNPANPKTLEVLQELGIKYILVHRDKFTPEGAKKYPAEYIDGQVPEIRDERAKFVDRFGKTDVYELMGEEGSP